ncbi:MAG TPA: EAL domain-containing protein [Gammaproteobacteria bacterium]|nr:EAL domain-containing protein [Gammaproteobacteria bacterium]
MADDDASRFARLADDPAFLQQLLDSFQHPFYVVDARDYSLVFANRATRHFGDIRLGETTCYALTHNRATPCAGEHPCPLDEIRRTGQPARTEHTHFDRDGVPYPVEVHGEPVFDDDGQLAYMMEYSLDISERKHLEQDLRQAAAVFHHASEGILITDAAGRIERVNDAFTRITGYQPQEAVGFKPREVLGSGWQDAAFYQAMWRTLTASGEWQGEIWNRRKNGSIYPEWLTISRVCDDRGAATHFIGIFSDITEQKKAESHLRRLAYFDPLTGLPNRATLEDRLEQALARKTRGQSQMALLYVDLDGFKPINDRHGHQAGDAVLREAGQRLASAVRETDTVARIGGDEFALLLEGPSDCRPEAVAEKLLAAFARPFRLPAGGTARLGLSIGILDCASPGGRQGEPGDILALADRAMYAAKSAGRNTYRFATQPAGEARHRGTAGKALERGELVLFYQPQVDLDGHRLAGVEALLRWRHPGRGLLLPGELLAEADNDGMLPTLGEWVLAQACRQQRSWLEAGGQPGPVAVNIAPSQWQAPAGLVEGLARALEHSDLAPDQLELEVPEPALARDPGHSRRVLTTLADMGVRLTIDDFGTGDTPLTLLGLAPTAKVKLSATLVTGFLEGPADAEPVRLVESICGLAPSLGLEVVAKGVETDDQCRHLQARGHTDMQGFYLARPQTAEDLAPAVHSGRMAEALS